MIYMLTVIVLGTAALVEGCGRGPRTVGVSWFEIAHQMRGTSKKASGRMQQRKR